MKKKVLLLTTAIATTVAGTMNVFAYYDDTGTKTFKTITTDTKVKGTSYDLEGYYDKPTVFDVGVEFGTFKVLPKDSFASDSSRKMTIKLYEDDVAADDYVRTYKISYSGRTPTTYSMVDEEEGYVELEVNSNIELYLTADLDSSNDDTSSKLTSPFKYILYCN